MKKLSLAIFYLFSYSSLASEIKKQDIRPFPLNKTLIKELKKQGSDLLSHRVGEYILRSDNLATQKKYKKAIELLEYHYNKDTLLKSEKSHFALHLAYLYKQTEKEKKALEYLKEAINLKNLPYHQHLTALYNQAQIYIKNENYKKGIELLSFWFSVNKNPYPQSYILLAQCYYKHGQTQKALKYVNKTLSLVSQPAESWLQFAVAIYFKQKRYKQARPYLERLVALYPAHSTHWKQLAGVYLYLNLNKQALITLEMADKMGHLNKESEYLNLSSLYMQEGIPFKAATLLKEKINRNIVKSNKKNLDVISEAFWVSRERKTSLAYLKQASTKTKEVSFFLKYGQRLLENENWKEAEIQLKKILNAEEIKETIKNLESYKKELLTQNKKDQKSNIKKRTNPEILKEPSTNRLENIYLGIGIALYQQKKYQESLSFFKKSIEVNDTFLSGYQWIDYTESTLTEEKINQKT